MAYQIHKAKEETEELQLFADGELKKTIIVRLDKDGLAQKLSDKHIELIHAQKEARQMQNDMAAGKTVEIEKAYEKVGQIIVDMFEAVFDKEDSDTIREFYGQNTIQMCSEVMPFITDVVLPKVRKLKQMKKKQKINGFKQKRFFG